MDAKELREELMKKNTKYLMVWERWVMDKTNVAVGVGYYTTKEAAINGHEELKEAVGDDLVMSSIFKGKILLGEFPASI